jgi:hypothetical protein
MGMAFLRKIPVGFAGNPALDRLHDHPVLLLSGREQSLAIRRLIAACEVLVAMLEIVTELPAQSRPKRYQMYSTPPASVDRSRLGSRLSRDRKVARQWPPVFA